jgi:hypothetical protein
MLVDQDSMLVVKHRVVLRAVVAAFQGAAGAVVAGELRVVGSDNLAPLHAFVVAEVLDEVDLVEGVGEVGVVLARGIGGSVLWVGGVGGLVVSVGGAMLR